MNILLTPGVYLPMQRAGSEIYLHKIAKYLQLVGHDVRCISHAPNGEYEYDGIRVYKYNKENWQTDNNYLWGWADLIFTQLSGTPYALNKMRIHKKKIVNFAHNNGAYAQIPLRNNIYTIYNCENTAKELNYNHDSIVCAPPVFKEHYKDVDRKDANYITLINHNENKGGKILIEIAKHMPNHKFLAVQGGYYEQIFDRKVRNITYAPMVEDIRPYLAKTKILIAPSEYESYGQAQVEAMCCGIPVIATKLKGFEESLQDAAYFIKDRNNIVSWCDSIMAIEAEYENCCNESLKRVDLLTPEKDLENINIWLNKISNLAIK